MTTFHYYITKQIIAEASIDARNDATFVCTIESNTQEMISNLNLLQMCADSVLLQLDTNRQEQELNTNTNLLTTLTDKSVN